MAEIAAKQKETHTDFFMKYYFANEITEKAYLKWHAKINTAEYKQSVKKQITYFYNWQRHMNVLQAIEDIKWGVLRNRMRESLYPINEKSLDNYCRALYKDLCRKRSLYENTK